MKRKAIRNDKISTFTYNIGLIILFNRSIIIIPLILEIIINAKKFENKEKYVRMFEIPTSFFTYISFILPDIHNVITSKVLSNKRNNTKAITKLIKTLSDNSKFLKVDIREKPKERTKYTVEKNNKNI